MTKQRILTQEDTPYFSKMFLTVDEMSMISGIGQNFLARTVGLVPRGPHSGQKEALVPFQDPFPIVAQFQMRWNNLDEGFVEESGKVDHQSVGVSRKPSLHVIGQMGYEGVETDTGNVEAVMGRLTWNPNLKNGKRLHLDRETSAA